jgi:hypothetical protein
MTKSDRKQKLQIPTRTAKPKGDMFANLRRREQVETIPFEELVSPATPSDKTIDQPQPNPTQPNLSQAIPPQIETAPKRDFNRRANSLERDALPAGLFPGTSKKLYDALYLRTRGAVAPTRTIQATKRELMTWSGIRSKNTIAVNLKILLTVGLIRPNYDPGNHEGTTYEILLPEELPTQPNPTQVTPSRPSPTQKLGLDPTQKLGWDGMSNLIENKDTSALPKTSFKTNTERSDDDDAALAGLTAALKQAAKELTGKDVSLTESARWRELAEVLITEAKIAGARTTVSSFPAFLAEHLRRRLWKKDKNQLESEGRTEAQQTPAAPSLTEEQIKSCPDCGGSTWYYPEGTEKGIKRCRHEKLQDGSQNAE